MLDQIRFYLKHSLNDLNVSKRLTFFALLSIAAGVAAIVSLQTLSLMISDTLESNLQTSNRGDVRASVTAFAEGDGQAELDALVEDGTLSEYTLSLFGQSGSIYSLAQGGLTELDQWLTDSPFADTVSYTTEIPLTNEVNVLLNTGMATSISIADTDEQASQLSAFVIDPAVYPYYAEIRTLDGQLLGDVLQAPTDIVLGENVTETIDVAVGDVVRVDGASQPFTVRGIVSIEEGVQNPLANIFAGLFGFYYINQDALSLFEGVERSYSTVYFKLDDPSEAQAFEDALNDAFPFLDTTSINDLREDNEQLVEQISQLSTVMGLISLLIGSIGIIHTMQVVVRRRMLEIAVLKTIGMQGAQVTTLFLTEALLLGIIGSIAGVVLGWAGTFVIKGAAEAIFSTTLSFRIALAPAVNGLVVGIIVATVFGFLPTLAAAQVRPGLVIRPQDNVVPRAGRLQTLAVMALIIVVIAFIAQTILGSTFVLALGVVAGAFAVAGVIYAILWALIWLIGRLMPSFGSVDLKVSLRQMLASKGRGASTLLALVVGVFSLSTITLFADAINNVLVEVLEGSGGNVLITAQRYGQLDDIEAILNDVDGFNSSTAILGYQVELAEWEDSETGVVRSADEIPDYLDAIEFDFPPFFNGTEEELEEIQRGYLEGALMNISIEAREIESESDARMLSGRDLTPADMTSETPRVIFTEDPLLEALGITAGDTVTYNIVSQGLFGASRSEAVTFEVAGIKAVTLEMSFTGGIYAPATAFPEDVDPSSVLLLADVADESVAALRRQLSEIPGTFVLETSVFTRLIESLLGTFTAFPSLVAALGLIVGGVVIANSVALSTMERRSEIAVMKAVGLQRERVLGMILLENGILGLIGGLIGVGIGLVAVIGFASVSGVPLTTIPWLRAFLLMALCVGVAIIAAVSSAWAASGEKPLTVLRYE